MVLTIRYFAGAKAAAGVGDEQLTLPPESTVDDVLQLVRDRHGERLARVLTASSLLLDGIAVRDTRTPVAGGVELDVLPPFAGG
ncbi:MoaD/ThiS family protein [Kutzneria kofuensis]|uniref:Molybdopterin converting factor small subunit n=1 Tax=Kutzneria kofuensis TaxID=103725 RepID=A0A7W9NG30_9PSEU|nr:MoaD/ThiS family protein [Kutzneria kofuensis]MBB5892117.1 molybdopterin converting factor small subunit [Kutzneria kofuensis]